MTDYDLFPGVSGPAAPVANGGPFTAGVCFGVRGGGRWLRGYRWWVCATGQAATPQAFALWSATSSGAGGLVAGSAVTSGPLTPGQWNSVLLSQPVPLAPSLDPANHANGSAYVACTGFTGAFPDTPAYWSAPRSNGPLTAYAGGGGGSAPYGLGQGLFSAASADPASAMPAGVSGTDNFWISPIITDVPPPGRHSLRLHPSKSDGSPLLTGDTSVAGGYADATEFHLSGPATADAIWFYSPPGSGALPSVARVRRITGTTTGLIVSDAGTPAWSGPAGSGWVWTALGGELLPAGHYKASVYCSDSTSLPKDAFSSYWTNGVGSGGIDWGVLSAPGVAGASPAYVYNTSGGGNTPVWTDGATVMAGQSTFARGGEGYAYLYADGFGGEWYTVDPEVTPAASSGLLAAGSGTVI